MLGGEHGHLLVQYQGLVGPAWQEGPLFVLMLQQVVLDQLQADQLLQAKAADMVSSTRLLYVNITL